jgi:hypothetical protein
VALSFFGVGFANPFFVHNLTEQDILDLTTSLMATILSFIDALASQFVIGD